MSCEASVGSFYETYYRRNGEDRNNLRSNPGVLFQTLALEASVVRASITLMHDPSTSRVLDVGCGNGGNLFQLLRLSYSAENFVGIDILPDRIDKARMLYPQMEFVHGDACQMPFDDASFDLVYESTMFATIEDDELSAGIAREMLRVCRTNGYLMLVDWWFPGFGKKSYKALSRRRLNELFDVGRSTKLVTISRGALVPVIGRFLSRFAPFLYFAAASFLPFLVGQVVYVLQRTEVEPVAREGSAAWPESEQLSVGPAVRTGFETSSKKSAVGRECA